ncbi:ATP-dependent DNA helicase RecG [Sporichthya sp.]|uniref:ATP-dependent DNA helicase RecG n=1 Tax=Sporichthya sp. TaxID=65475 RepID=UPI00181E2BC4|nr:ATP-dependent DNA helicase RecG [Sporichthya sp.]MBA3744690.1 ATP-dependent DNA helicase RecG [Sporichthya sp.]
MALNAHHPLGEALHRVLSDDTAKKLAKSLDLDTVGDLVRHFPRRYEKRGELTRLRDLEIGADVTVQAEVKTAVTRRMKNRSGVIREVVVTDGRDTLKLTFFGKGNWTTGDKLNPGVRGLFSGTISAFRNERQLTQPACFLFGGDPDDAEAFTDELIPMYPATAAVPSWQLTKHVHAVLEALDVVPDPLPDKVRSQNDLVSLGEALRLIHRPRDYGQVQVARKRLKWDEAFVLQIALAQRRAAARALPAVRRVAAKDGLLTAFDARLPFDLTAGQREIGNEISMDLACEHPMHRLLQGEVGSGKTVVALRAMLAVVDAGGQAALLAPTEVLAQQHLRSLSAMLGPLAEAGQLGGAEQGTRVALLTGSLSAAARKRAMLDAASGEAGIVVGTHALLQDKVDFFDLGLVVVDEQHRFGVEQRDALRAKGSSPPHLLVMTATPIPRTVAMTVFGDLDVSTLTELPAGRSPIATHVVPVSEKPHFLERAWTRIREEVGKGHQVYVVCPRIGADDADEDAGPDGHPGELDETSARRPAAAVAQVAPMLVEGPLAGLRIGVLHGRLPTEEKDATMAAFAARELDVLVATTVIEVGVDVANATVMAVLDADRFGMSQLHQLRGRVGRGSAPGLCLLVTEAPEASPARERLDAVASTTDGFALSQLDLEARREGDVLGTSQSGRRSSLRMLQVVKDADLIAEARVAATALVEEDPALAGQPALVNALADLLDAERAGYLEKA